MGPKPEEQESVWRYRLLAFTLIAGGALLRLLYLVYACPLDLAPDEAHYWDWSRHLDWSYYSKGPLVAWLIRASCWLLGDSMPAVRLPAVLCGALLLTSLYVLTVQVFRRENLALAVVTLGSTLPVLAAGSLLMTIDAPFTCCWGWALVLAYHAVFRCSAWAWLGAGLCVALGILAKHTMVLWLPMFGLFLLLTPSQRGLLLRPGFWVTAGVAALGTLPILLWNMQHDWITIRHTTGHAGLQSATSVHWLGPVVYVGMQFALLLGYWFVVWLGAMAAHHPGREHRPEHRFLWFMSAPLFLFFGLFSLKNGGGEPNWPVAGYLSGVVLAAGWLWQQWQSPHPWLRCATGTLVLCFGALGLALNVLLHRPALIQPTLAKLAGPPSERRPVPLRQLDPTCRLRGWRTLAADVDRIREELRAEGVEPILAGSGWNLPGEIGFYCSGQPEVFSFGPALGDRHSQYDLWHPNPIDEPEMFKGRTFILIGDPYRLLRAAFDQVEPTREVIHREKGEIVAQWQVTVCRGFRGFRAMHVPKRSY